MVVGQRPFWIPDATVIKKAALILFTFSALVGAHLVYTQAFVVIAERLTASNGEDVAPFPESESESKVRSNQLARENFGKGHWATQPVKIAYYDQSRNSYMYAQNYERKSAGKRLEISPFAMILLSKDGLSHKTITSDKAIVDMSQPFGLVKTSGEASKITHAELIGNVRIRDDKGTVDNPVDDLLIGPMTEVVFEDKTMQLTSKSDVVIQDQDMVITGSEMMIQLRRKNAVAGSGTGVMASGGGGASGGYDTETAFLYKNIHIKIKNVTPGGILVGQSKPDAQGQTPLDLQCAGQMRIDMPKPQPVAAVGPPNPNRDPDPTYARFEKDVRVIRGVAQRDQLNCDMLYLTLKPDPKGAEAKGAETSAVGSAPAGATATATASTGPAPAAGGPMTQLKLRVAYAQGHAVWVQSESQGLKAKCVELKYEKHLEEGTPDKTYLNGGSARKLWVEKVDMETEGPKVGEIKSVMNLESVDATILEYGGGGTSKVVARGPGKSEERPSRSDSVSRVAWFEDQMMLQSWRDLPKSPPDKPVDPNAPLPPLRRLITLTGDSKLWDVKSSSTLDAKEKIVAEFESGPKPPGSNATDGPTQIKWLQAFDNVHLATPGRTLTAWRKFEAWFVQPEPILAPVGPAVVNNLPSPVLGPIAPLEAPLAESKPDAPPAPVEGAVDGRANFVHATIVQGSANAKGEVRDAKLRGGVMVHQEPAPGEQRGKDASGEALDLFSQGKGMMKFAVAAEEPQANNPEAKTKLAAGGDPKSSGTRSRLASKGRTSRPRVLARVEFDGMVVESEKIIGLDQLNNFAWSLGHGSMVQLADKGLLDDKGLASDKSKPKGQQGPSSKDPLTISWNEEMKFYGRSRDKAGREVAKAEFRGTSEEVQTPEGRRVFRRGVEARMTDAAIDCDTMDVYMDKVVELAKAAKNPPGSTSTPASASAPNEPQAEIAMIESWGDNLVEDHKLHHAGVDITSRKYFPDTKTLKDKQRIQHTHVIYDKRTGDFEGSGAGMMYLYQGSLPKGADRPVVRTTSATGIKPPEPPAPTVKLTKIRFTELMRGRFGVAREGVDAETRTGEFTGNVQTANAIVRGAGSDLDFDQLDQKPDAIFLTSDVLRVRSEPPPVKAAAKAQARQLLYAQGNAAARTVDRIIQGDRITYDSSTDLMYIYGDDGKEVVMMEQKSPGQVGNRSGGKAVMYNNRTRQFEVNDPQSIQFYDLKSGIRPKALYPDLGGTPAKPEIKPLPRTPLQRPSRNSTERNGFTGH